MAGSYKHIIDNHGLLRDPERFVDLIDNLGDAYEAVGELYGMVWWLASAASNDPVGMVEQARRNYKDGLLIAEAALGGGDD